MVRFTNSSVLSNLNPAPAKSSDKGILDSLNPFSSKNP